MGLVPSGLIKHDFNVSGADVSALHLDQVGVSSSMIHIYIGFDLAAVVKLDAQG